MSPGDLDLRISVFEGPAPRISALMLFGHLLASPGGPGDGRSEYLILGRDARRTPPSWMSRSEVSGPDVDRLGDLLAAAGLPGRVPRVVANDSLLGAGPYVALEARLGGRTGSLNLPLQNAGFSGADSGPLRAVFLHLAELAPDGRRPAVRDVVRRLVIQGPPAIGLGRLRDVDALRGPFGAGCPPDGITGLDGSRGPIPACLGGRSPSMDDGMRGSRPLSPGRTGSRTRPPGR